MAAVIGKSMYRLVYTYEYENGENCAYLAFNCRMNISVKEATEKGRVVLPPDVVMMVPEYARDNLKLLTVCDLGSEQPAEEDLVIRQFLVCKVFPPNGKLTSEVLYLPSRPAKEGSVISPLCVATAEAAAKTRGIAIAFVLL